MSHQLSHRRAGLSSAEPTRQRQRLAPADTVVEFSVKVERLDDRRRVVALAGEVDMYTAPAVEGELRSAIDSGDRDLIVDLTEATFIDSTFLGVLTAAQRALATVGGRVVVVCSDRNLAKVFEITGLDHVFAIHSTLEEVAQALAPGGAAQ